MRVLSNDEVLSCATGYCQSQASEQGLLLLRFPDEALAYYACLEGWRIRTRCPAGVVLDFMTDSDALTVEACFGESMRGHFCFDLLVDGVLAGSCSQRQGGDTFTGQILPVPSGGKTRRWQLYLPYTRTTFLRAVGLSDGASFAPAPPRPVLLALGDSITQGAEAFHPSLVFIAVAARQLGMTLFNYGVGGAMFAAESLPKMPVASPALIAIAYGTNDFSAGLDPSAAQAYLRRVDELYPAVPVAVLAPLYRFGPPEGERGKAGITMAEYRDALSRIVERFPAMSLLPAGSLLGHDESLLADGLHPNESGHVVYGLNLAKQLASRRG